MTKFKATLPGSTDGLKYELIEIAGEGGMATVWRASTRGAAGFERQVAIKRLKPQFRNLQDYIDMFVEEARVGSELAHPNIVQVYDLCRDDTNTFYLVMEWVEGVDLLHYTHAFQRANDPTPWLQLVAICEGVLRGLSAAHERTHANGDPAPVIHRDVSPQNILVAVNGTVKLSDFGLARARDRMTRKATAPGIIKGKLSYTAPEILGGAEPGIHSDLFSMGVCLWEALAGRKLFAGRDELEILNAVLEGHVPSITELRNDIPPLLADVVARALAKEPAMRFATAREMANALAEVLRLEAVVDNHQLVADSVHWAREQNRQHDERPVDATPSVIEPTWSMVIEEIPVSSPRTTPPPPPGSTDE